VLTDREAGSGRVEDNGGGDFPGVPTAAATGGAGDVMAVGTRSVARQVEQRTSCPACVWGACN